MNFLKKLAVKLRQKAALRGYTCDRCGKEVFDYPSKRLCEDCETLLWKNMEAVCPKCGRKVLSQGVCLTCKSRMPKFTQGISAFVYYGETAALVNRFKNGERILGFYFAEKMANALYTSLQARNANSEKKENNANEPLLILSVPTTKARLRERGFNQAEDLAITVCKMLEKKGLSAIYDEDVLIKQRETSMQKHMHREERAKNVDGAYRVQKRSVCKNQRIVLIDDIMTTGATGSECAERLFAAGAKEVYFLTAASLQESK